MLLNACAPVKNPSEDPIQDQFSNENSQNIFTAEPTPETSAKTMPEMPTAETPTETASSAPETPKAPAEKIEKLEGTIEVFADFECPYCRRFEQEGILPLRTRHPEVQIIFRHFPLSIHANALPAAKYAVCAEAQGKFTAMNDALFATADLSAKNLSAIAKSLGLENAELTKCLSDPQTESRITADKARGQSLGVEGTPTFFINGTKYEGSYPVENLEKLLRENK